MVVFTHEQARVVWTALDKHLPRITGRVRRLAASIEGEGFEPEEVADPLAPENLLKSSGRGIFLIRNFMDNVVLQRAPEGGMEIRMTKRVQPGDASASANA